MSGVGDFVDWVNENVIQPVNFVEPIAEDVVGYFSNAFGGSSTPEPTAADPALVPDPFASDLGFARSKGYLESFAHRGYRSTFLIGPRGMGGPAWKPDTIDWWQYETDNVQVGWNPDPTIGGPLPTEANSPNYDSIGPGTIALDNSVVPSLPPGTTGGGKFNPANNPITGTTAEDVSPITEETRAYLDWTDYSRRPTGTFGGPRPTFGSPSKGKFF